MTREPLAYRYADNGKDLGGVLAGWGVGLPAAIIAGSAYGWLAGIAAFFLAGIPAMWVGWLLGWVAGWIIGRLLDAMIYGE
jgi:hypothetical protein